MNLIKLFFLIFSMLLILASAGCREEDNGKQDPSGEPAELDGGVATATPLPELSIVDYSITEGDEGTKNIILTVTCSSKPLRRKAVTVNWSTSNATGSSDALASAGEDYTSASGTLTFKRRQSLQKKITITVKGDVKVEEDELFLVTLENPVNATLSKSVGEVLIVNDDSGGSPEISNETKYANLPNGTVIADHFNDFSRNDYDGDAAYETISVSGQEFTEAVQVEIKKAPSADSRVNMTINSPIQLRQDDIILVSFYAKTVTASSTGAGHLEFLLQHNGEPWTEYVSWPLDLGTEWKRYYIPFTVQTWRAKRGEYYVPPPSGGDDNTFGAGEVRFRFSLGYHPQKLQFADMRIVNYGSSIAGTQLPVTSLLPKGNNIIISESSPSTGGGTWRPDLLAQADAGNMYLPDFSYAGYHSGEEPLPNGEGWKTINVLDYGATPNDETNDTKAIKNAITAAENISEPVILSFPPGKFIVRNVLIIDKENFILRGAGSGIGGTVLAVLRPMKEMTKPSLIQDLEEDIVSSNRRTDNGDLFSPFSWSGGVIWLGSTEFRGATGTAAETMGTALRGSHTLSTKDASNVTSGDTVQLRYNDNSTTNPLHDHVYGCSSADLPEGFGGSLSKNPEVWQNITVESVSGNVVKFKEPLNHDIQSGWSGQLKTRAWFPEMGVEGIAIEFPNVHYAGHHIEEGYNGIFIKDGLNCWVRDVKITNSDSGIIIETSKNVTVQNVVIDGRGGHYALMTADSDQVLFRDFQSDTQTCHSLSFNTASRTAVYTHGRVNAVSFDQHNGMNHQNLMEDLDVVGETRDIWVHGGNDSERPTHGAFNTFWNLRFSPAGQVPVQGTSIKDGPNAYMIGLSTDALLMFTYGPDAYTEGLGRRDLAVQSLYDYQLTRRTSKGAAEEQ
ncbi:MAG: glycosyl hydrolase family 28-related protein [Candidatus Electrothrix sp. Rat3]|nr:glycosyl hydrolase family 28-related protein [Candidatus Electrothrix rattekaaiensis]